MKVIVLLIQVPLFALMATIAIGSAPHFSVPTISTGSSDSGSQMTMKVVAILWGDDVLARPRQAKSRVDTRSTDHLKDSKAREATAVRMREKSCINRHFSVEDSTGEAVFGVIV